MNRAENGVSGQNLQALLQDGLRAHQAGRLADAEAAYRRLLGLDADHAYARIVEDAFRAMWDARAGGKVGAS